MTKPKMYTSRSVIARGQPWFPEEMAKSKPQLLKRKWSEDMTRNVRMSRESSAKAVGESFTVGRHEIARKLALLDFVLVQGPCWGADVIMTCLAVAVVHEDLLAGLQIFGCVESYGACSAPFLPG